MKSGSIVVLLSALLAGCQPGGSSGSTPNGQEPFTVVLLPDTQNAVDYTRQTAAGFAIDSSELFLQQMRYIAGRGRPNGGDVVFVASVGDVWQHVSSGSDPAHEARGISAVRVEDAPFQRFINPDAVTSIEIPTSVQGYEIISDAGVPFGVAPGNHDYDAWWSVAVPGDDEEASDLIVHIGGLDNFRSAFGSDTAFFSGKDWYVSATNGGGSSAQTFEGGDYRFLHLALEMQAGDAVLEWARSVIEDFPGLDLMTCLKPFYIF